MRNILYFFLGSIFLVACNDDVLPKPKAYLSLQYPIAMYEKIVNNKPYLFEMSKNALLLEQKNHWVQIRYLKLKASIDITYRPIQNNLKELLVESEKLVYKHVIKATQIMSDDFDNPQKRVFGSLYTISGNAASQLQFHVTDSTKNFIKGALYFYTKPNYDSVLPAVEYIKKDIIHLIETLEWKE